MLHHALNTRPQPVARWPHAAALGLALTAGCGRAALLGTFNHRYLTDPPTVDDPTIGRSRRHVIPAPLHIRVGEDGQGMMGYIGRTAHRALFAAYPPFDFNVVFNVADSDLWTGVSDYANPDSIWYNIFFGYYDIRVSTRLWRRPFGYVLTSDPVEGPGPTFAPPR